MLPGMGSIPKSCFRPYYPIALDRPSYILTPDFVLAYIIDWIGMGTV